jgi:hypothetical protein
LKRLIENLVGPEIPENHCENHHKHQEKYEEEQAASEWITQSRKHSHPRRQHLSAVNAVEFIGGGHSMAVGTFDIFAHIPHIQVPISPKNILS